MFTGIVLERGRLTAEPVPAAGGVRMVIGHSEALTGRLAAGASLAVNGVCLTVTEALPGRSTVELSPETLARTTLLGLRQGSEVNLEPALRAGDALGGHWVQGHVDGVVRLLERRDLADFREAAFSLPPDLEPYVVEKGSVTLDGVSLTVSALPPGRFEVALIPHTLQVTTLGDLDVGGQVNLEVDILAKYVDRVLTARGLGAR